MLLLSIIFIGSLALLLPASDAEVHKKIVIHVPLEIHKKHHTHTVYKHVYHKEKEEHKHPETKHKHHGKGKDSYEFLGYSYGKPSAWKEEKHGWKSEESKWPGSQWKESHKHETKWHEPKKNPHRISSYIPNYNHEKKRAEIFEHEHEHHHKHKPSHHHHHHHHNHGGHKHSGESGEDFNSFQSFGRDLKGSGSHKHFDHHEEEDDFEDKKNIGLGITKVISHTVYHD